MACLDSNAPVIGGFSSDDEREADGLNMLPEKPSRKLKISSRHVPATNGGNDPEDNDHSIIEEVLLMTDDQLLEKLKGFNVDVGPVVDTTRVFYRKMLTRLLNEGIPVENGGHERAKDEAGPVADNKRAEGDILAGLRKDTDQSNEYFSADDEVNKEDYDEVFHTAKIIKQKTSNRTILLSNASPFPDGLRIRDSGTMTKTNKDGNGNRFVPSPRRSIRSYKVETSSVNWTESDDTQTDEFYKEVPTTINDANYVAKEGGKISILLKYLPSLLLLLILATLGYYVYLGVGMGILSPLLSKIEITAHGFKDLLLGWKGSILGGQDKGEAS